MASADDAELLIAESVFLDDGADDMYDPYERERDQGGRSSAHALSTVQSISSAARTSTASISSFGNRGQLDAGPGSKELSESFLLATVDVSQDAGLITTDVRPLTATAVGGTNTTGFGARASQHLRFQPTSVMPGPEHERSSHSSASALGLGSLAVTSGSNKSGISAHSGTSAALHNATATAGGDEDLDEFEKLERQLMRISGSTGAQPAPGGGASSDFAETSGLRSSISSMASSVAASNRAGPGSGSAPDGRATSSSSLQAGSRQAETAPSSAASQLPRHPVTAGIAASRSSNNAQPRLDNSNSAAGTDGAFIRKEAPHLQAAQSSAQRPPSHFNGNHFSAQQHPVQQHQQPHAQTEAPVLEGLSDTERQLANLVHAKVSALQQQIDRYNAEVARLKDTENSLLADRKKIEEDAKQLSKERAEFKGWREAEHSRFESWRNDVTRKLEQERRVAVRQARAAAAAATALPDRQARTELEETQKANSKLKADLQAAEARYKATVERHRNEKKALQDRVDELERQVQRYEDERIAVVFGSQASASTAAAAVAASAPPASNGFVPPSSQLTSFTGARKGSFSSASGLGSGTAAGHVGAGPWSSLGGSAAAATGGQARGHSRGRSIEAGKRAAGAHTAGRINASGGGGGRGRPGSMSASTRGINSRVQQHHDAPSSSALDDAEAPAPAAVSYNPARPSGAASSGGNDLTLENVPGASSSSPSAKHAEVGANGQVFRDSVTHDSETPTGFLQTILGRSTNGVNQSSAAAEMSLAGALAQAVSKDGYNPARYGSSASASSVAPHGGPALPKAPASQPSIYAPTIPQRLATSGPRAHEVPTAQHMLGGGVAAGNGSAGRTATAGAAGASASSPLKAPASSLQAQQLHQQTAQAVTVSPSSKQQQPSSLAAVQAQSQPAPVVMSSLLRLHLQHHRYTPEQLRLGVLDDFDPRTGQPIDVLFQRNLDDKGKVEYKFADGSRLVRFKNGTEKEQRGDGTAIVRFGNGDVKRSVPRLPEHGGGGGVIDIYYYAGANTIQATYPPTSISGSPRDSDLALSYDIFEFPSGQIELHWGSATGSTGDGSAHSIPGIPQPGDKEILFADGTIKTVDGATGEARSTLPDGRTVVETPQ